jgi:hypothetical protein
LEAGGGGDWNKKIHHWMQGVDVAPAEFAGAAPGKLG